MPWSSTAMVWIRWLYIIIFSSSAYLCRAITNRINTGFEITLILCVSLIIQVKLGLMKLMCDQPVSNFSGYHTKFLVKMHRLHELVDSLFEQRIFMQKYNMWTVWQQEFHWWPPHPDITYRIIFWIMYLFSNTEWSGLNWALNRFHLFSIDFHRFQHVLCDQKIQHVYSWGIQIFDQSA